MKKRIVAIIPARYDSSRFPGKPLKKLNGISVIQRTYEQSQKAIEDVYVATDDHRIFEHVKDFGGNALMTSSTHISGTDRISEAASQIKGDFDYVINVQGDEPLIHPDQIRELCDELDGQVQIATQAKRIQEEELLENPNCVKVVFSNTGQAMYFSRARIPFLRNEKSRVNHYQHIGIYAYRSDILTDIVALPFSSKEAAESLEQLRWLDHDYKIKVITTNHSSIGIDTPEDLLRAEKLLSGT